MAVKYWIRLRLWWQCLRWGHDLECVGEEPASPRARERRLQYVYRCIHCGWRMAGYSIHWRSDAARP